MEGRMREQAIVAWLVTTDLRQRGLRRLTDAHVAQLAHLLQTQPAGLAQPVVFGLILHLARLARTGDADDLPALAEDHATPPPGTRRKAQQVLQRILEAWLAGLLAKARWEVRIRPRARRGAPPKRTARERLDFQLAFEDMKAELADYPPISFKPRSRRHPDGRIERESREAFLARVTAVVQDVHWLCPVCGAKALPATQARAVAEAGMGTTQIDKNRLVCALLAQCAFGTVAQAPLVRSILRK
jgi:hypothetical protein